MNGIGTNQGAAYNGREGQGNAEILQGDAIAPLGAALARREAGKRQDAALALKKRELDDKERADAVKALGEVNPEYWINHAATKAKLMDGVHSMGVDLIAKGINNPFIAADPESKKFQEKVAKLEEFSNYSMQQKDLYGVYQKQLFPDGVDKTADYTDGSLVEVKDYFSLQPEEIIARKLQPPQLIRKEPAFDLYAFDKQNTGDNYNNVITKEDAMIKAATSMDNPKVGQAVLSMTEPLKKIQVGDGKTAYDMLTIEAKNEGFASPEMYLRTKQIESYFGNPLEKFDFDKIEKDLTASMIEYSNEDTGGVTNFGKTANKEKTLAIAKMAVSKNPTIVMAARQKGMYGTNKTESIEDSTKKIETFFYDKMIAEADSASGVSRQTGGATAGHSTKEVDEDFDIWMRDLQSDNATSPSYVTGVKLADGLIVDNARLEKQPNGDLILKMSAKGSPAMAKEAMRNATVTDPETGKQVALESFISPDVWGGKGIVVASNNPDRIDTKAAKWVYNNALQNGRQLYKKNLDQKSLKKVTKTFKDYTGQEQTYESTTYGTSLFESPEAKANAERIEIKKRPGKQ